MNPKFKELYSYLKSNQMTDLDESTFYSKYSDPSKSKEIHSYLKSNKMTDLDETSFHSAYFGGKKKDLTELPSSSITEPSLSDTSKKAKPAPSESSVSKDDGIYEYSGRKGAIYKKQSGKWLVDTSGTGKFIELKDPEGTRSSTLNKQAKKIYNSPFEDENLEWSEAPSEVSKTPVSEDKAIEQKVFASSFEALDKNDPIVKERELKEKELNSILSNFSDKNVGNLNEDSFSEKANRLLNSSDLTSGLFNVSPTGAGYNAVTITNKLTGEKRDISLKNWSSERDNDEAKILKAFVEVNSKFSDLSKMKSELNKLEESKSSMNTIDRIEVDKKISELKKSINVQNKLRNNYALSDKYRAAAVFNASSIQEAKDKLTRLQLQSIDVSEEQKELDKYNQNLLDAVSDGRITRDEYDKNYLPKIKSEQENITYKALNVRDNAKDVYSDFDNIDVLTALNFAAQQDRGNILTGSAKSFMEGAESVVRFAFENTSGLEQIEAGEIASQLTPGIVTKEFLSSSERSMFEQAIFGVMNSFGAATAGMVIPGGGQVLGMYASSYMSMKDQMNDPSMSDVPEYEKILLSGTYGAVIAALEKLGIDKMLSKNPVGKNALNWIMSNTFKSIPKNASKDALESAINDSIKTAIAKGIINTSGAALVEGATEGLQEGFDIALKEVYNSAKGKDFFEGPKSITEALSQIGEATALGMIGGGVMSGLNQAIQTPRDLRTASQFNEMASVMIDENLKDIFLTSLKGKVLSGEMTKAEAMSVAKELEESQAVLDKIPKSISKDNKFEAFKLINEKQALSTEINGMDENLTIVQRERIKEINNELQQISRDAVQEQATSQVPVQPETRVGEEVVEGESKTEPQQVVEEGKKEEIVAVETNEPKSYSQALNEARDEMGKGGPGLELQVSPVSEQEAQQIVDEGGKIFMTEDGLSGAYVKKDGYMGGLFKSPKSKFKDVAKVLQQARIKAGGYFMDAYSTKLEDIYIKNGFRPVARLKFNEEFAPEGWDSEGSPLKTKPDVVFFAYDPEGKYSKGDGQYLEDYDQAYDMAKNFKPEQEVAPTEVTIENAEDFKRKAATESDNVNAPKIVQAAKSVMRALPGLKIHVHTTQESYLDAISKLEGKTKQQVEQDESGDRRSGGTYMNGEIHVDLSAPDVTARTVYHEAFHHALLTSGKVAGDMRLMVNGIKKALGSKHAELVSKIEEFESIYSDSDGFTDMDRAEEFLSELGAVLAESSSSLDTNTLQRIANIINKIAERLVGRPIFSSNASRQEIIDFMNSMSRGMARGEVVNMDIDVAESITPGAFIDGVVLNPKKSLSKAKVEGFDTTPTNDAKESGINMVYPDKISIENVLEQSGGAAVFINSDGTKVGKVTVNGKELILQGGVDYTFIEDNVKDNIGFAASENAKISSLQSIASQIITERDSKYPEHKGKPVAVFVTAQNGETMLGEWYAGEYIMEGIDSAIESNNYNGGIDQAKLDFEQAIKAVKTGTSKEGKSDKIAKDKLLNMISDGKFDTREGRLEMSRLLSSKEFSFGFRVNLNKGLIASNENSSNSGIHRNIKKSLANVGHTLVDFWNKFMDGRILKSVEAERLAANKGAAAANKTFSGFFYNPSESLESQIEHAKLGIEHAQFNSSFKSQGNFLLDSAYNINKLFPNMGYPTQKGIDEYNSSNKSNVEKKTMSLMDKIKVSEWLISNNKQKLVVNPYSSVSLSIYTGVVTEVPTKSKQESKSKKRLTAPNGKPSNLNEKQWNQVRTPEFKKWFGDWENDPENASKVIDENGEPLVVYHGSVSTDIDIFDRLSSKRKGSGLKEYGLYFTDNIKLAEAYRNWGELNKEELEKIDNEISKWENIRNESRNNKDYENAEQHINMFKNQKKGKVYPVFLNLRNIKSFDAKGEMNIEAWNNLEVKASYKWAKNRDAMEFLKEGRFGVEKVDGIKAENIVDASVPSDELKKELISNVYLVFDGNENNIKSATENVGTFSTEEKSIKKRISGSNSKKQAIDDAKSKYDLSVNKRKNSHQQGVQAAIGDLQKSDWYKQADDTQREEAVREIKSFLGEKLKKAPSVAKVLGKPKDEKVTNNVRTLRNEFIKARGTAAREAKADLKTKQRAIVVAVNQMKRGGFITAQQASSLAKRIVMLNVDNAVHVEKFMSFAEKIFADAEYNQKLSNAKSLNAKIKKAMKSEGNQATSAAIAKEFSKIDPKAIEDIDMYIEMAEKVLGAVKPSRVKGLDVDFKTAMDFEAVSEYVDIAMTQQEEFKKSQMLAVYSSLEADGVISDDMSLKEIMEIVASINESEEGMPSNEKAAYIMAYVSKVFDTYSPIIKSMLRGTDPFTGDSVTITDKQRDIMQRLLKINVESMDIRDAIRIIEAMDNFSTNAITDGVEAIVARYEGVMNAKSIADSGFKARETRTFGKRGQMFDSASLGRVWAQQMMTMKTLADLMFRGPINAIKVLSDIGFSSFERGVSRATKVWNTSIDTYYNSFRKKKANGKKFMDADNIIERGMYASLRRTIAGDVKAVDAELKRKIKLIADSIEVLRLKGDENQKALADIYEQTFNKLGLGDANITAADIESRVDQVNKQAVDWWIEEWGKHYGDLVDVSENVYNTKLGKDLFYTTDRFSSVSRDASIEEAIEKAGGGGFASAVGYEYDKKTGVLMPSTKPISMGGNRFLDLNFDMNNSKALKAALVDINTAAATRQINGALSSDYWIKIIPNAKDREMFRGRVDNYILRSRNKSVGGVQGDLVNTIEKSSRVWATMGAGRALGGVFQPVKQVVPVALNTLINAGRLDLLTPFGSQDFHEWLDKSGLGIAGRGMESQAGFEDANKMLEDAAMSGNIAKVISSIERANRFGLKYVLVSPDVWIARSSFKSYYIQGLKMRGESTDIDWKNHEVNVDAAQYAQHMVDRQQNVSDSALSGEFLASSDPARKIAKNVLFPFASFVLNQKSRMFADFSTITNRESSDQDRVSAARSLAGLATEMALFQGISFYIRYLILNQIAQAITGHEPDDEEKEETLRRQLEYSAGTMVKDIFSPIPLTDSYAIDGGQYMFDLISNTFSDSRVDAEKALIEYNESLLKSDKSPLSDKDAEKWIEKFVEEKKFTIREYQNNQSVGMYGITLTKFNELMSAAKLAYEGEFERETPTGQKTKKYILDKDRDNLKNLFPALAVYNIIGFPAELSGLYRNVENHAKKTKSITEKQFETYKELGVKNPSIIEEYLIRNTRATENSSAAERIKEELDRIEKWSGKLNDDQMKRYIEIKEANGDVGLRDLTEL
jgi:hypothetical protein